MRKGAKEVVVGSDTVKGTVPERDMVIEIVRGTKTDAVKEMEREDIAVTDLVRLATVDIATVNATVIAIASGKGRIEIETGIADEEEMTWMIPVKWKVAQREKGQTISLMI